MQKHAKDINVGTGLDWARFNVPLDTF